MGKIKAPSVAGTFYSADTKNLAELIKSFKQKTNTLYNLSARAVIVPHAGLVYSGLLAYKGISQLDKSIENIFIFAPSHHVGFDGGALSSYDGWETPMGTVNLNTEICKELETSFGLNFNDTAFEKEHSVEIQLPIIQYVFGEKINIIPVLLCNTDFHLVESIISKYYPDNRNGFVISSDLSHFWNDEDARKLDSKAAWMIETGNIDEFNSDFACGYTGIKGLVQFANNNKYSLIRIDMQNSSVTTHDKTRVVGYGTWFLYEGNTNELIEKYYSDFVINVSRKMLHNLFERTEMRIDYPQIFQQNGACFVTLEKNGNLRGCIGSIIAHRPLIYDLVHHTADAALNDYRFPPVKEEELEDIKISVSILSEPQKISFNSEEDLLDKIIPNHDGIIIKDKEYQSVYLPSVWEQIPDKREFLSSLKIKAGLTADYFSDTFEAFKFETIYIKEK